MKSAASRLVLIVDDVADNRDLYEFGLKAAGFRVQTAERAEDAIEMVHREPPDLIVMDHNLPGLDGCEATRVLKKDAKTAHIPVLMVTGHAITSIEELARECGADDFRTKPLTPTNLVAAIEALFARPAKRQ